jgi:hypothetical protein
LIKSSQTHLERVYEMVVSIVSTIIGLAVIGGLIVLLWKYFVKSDKDDMGIGF